MPPDAIVCPWCERTHAVNRNGRVRSHKNVVTGRTCTGSGRDQAGMALAPRARRTRTTFIEVAIADAERHGRESETDHEVGDLQALVRQLAGQMSPDQLARAEAMWRPWDAD